jgi:hypothetical protein
MSQISQFAHGERDYTAIKGGTGPLVYPAAHVWIYYALWWVTDHGRDILVAQRIFGVLYLGTLGLVLACYRRAKVRVSLSIGDGRECLGNEELGLDGIDLLTKNCHV